MVKEIRNIGASVRARLLQLAKANDQSFDLVLTRFALERLLFRLSQSRHAKRFVLKGAMLMMSWFDDPHRGTRDLDLLGFGDPSAEPMLATFREILTQEAGDGVEFDADALRVDRIREELEYGGLRLRTTASISGARISRRSTSALAMHWSLVPKNWTILQCSISQCPDYGATRGKLSSPRSSRRWWRWGVPTPG